MRQSLKSSLAAALLTGISFGAMASGTAPAASGSATPAAPAGVVQTQRPAAPATAAQ
ncbi:hypothetical protein GXW71_12970, partial [Roseomonas hellenica]|nr:hypothetical protein [Plastoroseomonas hellenica]